MRICFFAKVPSADILDTVNFYAQDIRVLKDLGHDVVTATRFREIPTDCDLYFVWWWSWAFLPYFRARVRRKPMVITGVYDYSSERIPGIGRPWWKRQILRSMLHRADANVFVSTYEMQLVARLFGAPNAWYIPCTVDTERYRPGLQPRQRFLLNVAWSGATNGRRKCLREIIEAMPAILSKHPDTRLLMAGRQGEYHQTLVDTAKSLHVEHAIDFLGVISEETKVQLMQTCAAYLQPTLLEGFGLAIAEAIACEAPVITNPQGAVPEVVGPGAILLERPEPSLIAAAATRLLDDREFAADMGRKGRQHVLEHFTYPVRRDGLAKVIDHVTSARETSTIAHQPS
ncbi:MAG: glycosyltransferase family 4 protein [Gemmatimonadales bacterium]|nr:glycosyltransferase family 4 protein [Gemmatimonadales bacterium]